MGKRIRETSTESFNIVSKTLSERYAMVMECLEGMGEATANEIAMKLTNEGKLPYFTRNFVHPRLTELVDKGKVITVGKKLDSITNRTCILYKLPTDKEEVLQ